MILTAVKSHIVYFGRIIDGMHVITQTSKWMNSIRKRTGSFMSNWTVVALRLSSENFDSTMEGTLRASGDFIASTKSHLSNHDVVGVNDDDVERMSTASASGSRM